MTQCVSKQWSCGTFLDGIAHVEREASKELLQNLESEEESLRREIQEFLSCGVLECSCALKAIYCPQELEAREQTLAIPKPATTPEPSEVGLQPRSSPNNTPTKLGKTLVVIGRWPSTLPSLTRSMPARPQMSMRLLMSLRQSPSQLLAQIKDMSPEPRDDS